MSAELHTEDNEGNEVGGLSLLELGTGVIVAVASAYITIAHILPQTDAYIAANVAPKIAGNLILWSRLGAALIASSAVNGAVWVVAGRLAKTSNL